MSETLPLHELVDIGVNLTHGSLLRDRPVVVAVGECGLDDFRDFSLPADRRRCFAAQLELAAGNRLPSSGSPAGSAASAAARTCFGLPPVPPPARAAGEA